MLKKKFVMVVSLLGILVMVVIIAGCNESVQINEDVQGDDSQEISEEDSEVSQGISFEDDKEFSNVNYGRPEKTLTDSSAIDIEEFKKIFPPQIDLEFFYEGAEGKGFRQRNVVIHEEDEKVMINGIGQTKNMFEENPVFHYTYNIDKDGVRLTVTNRQEYHPDYIKDLVVLRGPLEVGTTWEQYVDFPYSSDEPLMKAVIVDISELESGAKKYIVRYAINTREFFDINYEPDDFYKEERHFVEGKGLVFHAYLEDDGTIVGYELEHVDIFGS